MEKVHFLETAPLENSTPAAINPQVSNSGISSDYISEWNIPVNKTENKASEMVKELLNQKLSFMF
jgi:hypothetical protein